MTNTNPIGGEESSALSVISATLNSSRMALPIDISSVLSELVFYEHMNKPFVTGYLTIVDNERISEGLLDVQGAEIFELIYKRNTDRGAAAQIKQRFVVQRIEKAVQSNEFTQVINFRLIDEGVYRSGLKNVNKVIEGQPHEIIDNILKDYLDRDDLLTTAFYNTSNKTKVIVPNMTPLETAEWIRNRSVNANGYPYYFYKTAITNKYIFADLETLLSSPVINANKPFTDNQAAGSSLSSQRDFIIHGMEQAEVDDLYAMIRSGVVGSQQRYYDVTTADYEIVNFNINNDVMVDIEKLNKNQKRPLIDGNLKFDDLEISNYVSKVHSHVSSSKPFKDVKAYDEAYIEGENQKKIKSRALQHLLGKSPLKIVVDGDAFIQGNEDFGIGNSIRVLVRAKSDKENGTKIDRKQSGDYLIVAANYTMKFNKSNKIEMVLLCAKIANYQSDSYNPVGGGV